MMGHGAGILLVTAIGGYWVLERADRHKGGLKTIGRVLGAVIIVASLIGVACRVGCVASAKGWCPTGKMGRSGTCPFSPGTDGQQAPAN